MNAYDKCSICDQSNSRHRSLCPECPYKSLKIFWAELTLIRNTDLRHGVVRIFERLCPDTFWTQSASTTGKYHPRVSNGEGGLVRHTKLAVWWGVVLAKAFELEDLNDEVVAALLLHDVLKRHDNVGTHGSEMAYAMNDYIPFVTEGIAYHMGKWTSGDGKNPKGVAHVDFCNLIHLADYCAGRKVDEKLEELYDDCQKLLDDHHQEADENLLTQAYDLVRRISDHLYDYTSPNVTVHKAVLAADRELLNRALVLLALVNPKSRKETGP